MGGNISKPNPVQVQLLAEAARRQREADVVKQMKIIQQRQAEQAAQAARQATLEQAARDQKRQDISGVNVPEKGKRNKSGFTNTTNTEHFTEQNTTSNIIFYFILILIIMLILYTIRKNRLNNNK